MRRGALELGGPSPLIQAGQRMSVFDDLSNLSDSPASYLAVLALVALDAILPVAPSETVLVTGGVLIERGKLIAPVFVLAAASGAVLGDSILFGLGSAPVRACARS